MCWRFCSLCCHPPQWLTALFPADNSCTKSVESHLLRSCTSPFPVYTPSQRKCQPMLPTIGCLVTRPCLQHWQRAGRFPKWVCFWTRHALPQKNRIPCCCTNVIFLWCHTSILLFHPLCYQNVTPAKTALGKSRETAVREARDGQVQKHKQDACLYMGLITHISATHRAAQIQG